MNVMILPANFKIRKKNDIETFINNCMMKDGTYGIKIDKETLLYIKKDEDGNVSVLIKRGNLRDVFNPLLEVAATNNSAYKETVQDYIWKYRKYINAEYFSCRIF